MFRKMSVGLALLWTVVPTWAGTASAQAAPVVQVRDAGSLGSILTDAKGMTLYVFTVDTPDHSNCSGGCATAWPPAMASSATLPPGTAGTLSLITRDDGSQQLDYNGAPLYTYSGDKAPGDTNGQGVGGNWFVAKVGGAAAAAPAPAPAAGGNGCQFVLGFKDLHDMDAADIGDCTDNQAFVANGDAQQHTTKGLLVWRKADNWTAFTNGNMTWINGPDGLVSRLNSDRFPWEGPDSPAAPASAPAAPAPAAPAAAPAPAAPAPVAATSRPAYSY